MNVKLSKLFPWLRPYIWPHFAGALACMVIYGASSGAVPYLVRSMVDDIFENQDEATLRLLPGLIIAVFVLRGVVNFGQAYLGEYVGQRIVFDLRATLQSRIQHLPLSFFDRASTSNVVTRITSDVLLVRQALTDGAAAMIRDATTVVMLIIVAFFMDPALSLIAFVAIPVVVVPLQALSRKMRKLSHVGQESLGYLSSLLQETIQGARVVKAFGMEDYEKSRFRAENERLLQYYMRAAWIRSFTSPLSEVITAFGIAAVLWYGGTSVLAGGRTTGSFMAVLTCIVLVYEPFKKLVRTNNIVQTGLGAAERVFEVLEMEPEREVDAAVAEHARASAPTQSIRFEGVEFSYDTDDVLHGVDLEIGAGQVVALVGPSGGGKSTMADLIPRFYEVECGRISMDGRDMREFDLASLRSLIAVVTQHTFLFNDTVRANIAYGHENRSDEEVFEAARAANAHEFILGLPKGYDTVIGEMGLQLSGGQRQRLAIARALLKDAPILILDEATSALDNESERLVQAAIERLVRGRTTLVIAHRLSTIRTADRIAVVSRGRVEAEGTHEQLLASSATYQRLHRLQFAEVEGDEATQPGGGDSTGPERFVDA